jgi:hypothetical protein
VRREPVDARLVDVDPVGLPVRADHVRDVAQDPPRTAAEVQHARAIEPEVGGQLPTHHADQVLAVAQPRLHGILVPPRRRPHHPVDHRVLRTSRSTDTLA